MLTREQMMHALGMLGAELEALGLQGEVLLTGGACMCLVHAARDMTQDIDALYEPKAVINDLAAKIASEANLPSNWLNDSVKGYVTENAPREDFIRLPGLCVTTVTAEYLLAMKLVLRYT